MSEDLRAAISVALLMFSGLLSLVTTGAVVMPPRAATSLRDRRWRWAPTVLLIAAIACGILLSWWPSRLLCLGGAALSVAALNARPRVESAPRRESGRSAVVRDNREIRRTALVFASLFVLAAGVFASVAASQG